MLVNETRQYNAKLNFKAFKKVNSNTDIESMYYDIVDEINSCEFCNDGAIEVRFRDYSYNKESNNVSMNINLYVKEDVDVDDTLMEIINCEYCGMNGFEIVLLGDNLEIVKTYIKKIDRDTLTNKIIDFVEQGYSIAICIREEGIIRLYSIDPVDSDDDRVAKIEYYNGFTKEDCIGFNEPKDILEVEKQYVHDIFSEDNIFEIVQSYIPELAESIKIDCDYWEEINNFIVGNDDFLIFTTDY